MEKLEINLGQGWSKGLNICFENQKDSANINLNNSLHVKQVHGDVIYEVGPSDLKKEGPLAEADALILSGDWALECTKPLLIKTADCCPLFYIDRSQKIIAAVHAGWRGLALGLHKKVIDVGGMDPATTWVWLGPSLNGSSFEVGEDMYSKFSKNVQNNPKIFAPHQTDSAKKYFHTWEFLEEEFKQQGIEVFYNFEIDTFADPSFASWRRDQTSARNYSWVGFHTFSQ